MWCSRGKLLARNRYLAGSTVGASINPRSDGILIGNMMERGNASLEPDAEVRQRNVDAAIRFFATMRPPGMAR